jgi:hypothetical protein
LVLVDHREDLVAVRTGARLEALPPSTIRRIAAEELADIRALTPVQVLAEVQAAGGQVELRVELVQPPAQSVLQPGFSSRDAWVCSARGRSGSRTAARAIASASIGSDLPRVRALVRVNAISFGGTRTTTAAASKR